MDARSWTMSYGVTALAVQPDVDTMRKKVTSTCEAGRKRAHLQLKPSTTSIERLGT